MTALAEMPRETAEALEAQGTRALRAMGIEGARAEARLLLRHAAGLSAEALIAHPRQAITAQAASTFRAFIRRRMSHEPVAYILGVREFWSLPFQVNADVLIPRPDSETLIEAALARIADRKAKLSVLDLGTGSGCLLLSLLSELPQARGIGIDRNEDALSVARANAQALGLSARAAFRCGDWSAGLEGSFDIVLSNPPYIPQTDISTLAPDVAEFEPHGALCGGADGFDAYRRILADLPRVLAPQGWALLELGAGQAAAVGMLAKDAGFAMDSCVPDLAGHLRCLVLRRGTDKKNRLESGG